jgi:hypothetical protein
MSQYSESYRPRTEEVAAEPSTSDAVRNEAADVAQHARQAGGQVTQTATEQTRQVAAETGRQARGLLDEAQGQVRGQASAQQQKAAQQLHSVADELGQMVDTGGQSGVVTDFARQAAGRLHNAATWLEQRDPADLLDQARNFARRRPGAFLIGAAVAGLAAGRMTRGLAAGSHEQQGADVAAAEARAATTADWNELASPPVAAETARAGYAEPVYSPEPLYPAGPGSAASPGYPVETGPLDTTIPDYPADAPFPPEPGRTPGSGGTS